MFYLQHSEVQFYLRLCVGGAHLVAEEATDDFSTLLHKRLLAELVGVRAHLADSAGKLTHFGESLDYGKRGLRGGRAFEYGGSM